MKDKSLTTKLDKAFREAMRIKKPRETCFVCGRRTGYFTPKKTGIKRTTLRMRLDKYGYSVEKTLTEKVTYNHG